MAYSYRILVVDDERPMARALELKLTREGYEVVVAHNGKQGIEAFEANEFDVVILDLVMPVMDGFSVLKVLGKRDVRILVCSNLSQREDIARVRELGASDYFIKSNTPLHKIVELVHTYIPRKAEVSRIQTKRAILTR